MKNILKNRKIFWLFSLVIALVGLVVILIPEKAFAEKLYEVLKQTGDNQPGTIVKQVWTSVLNVVNIAVIGVLIFIAFANILRININTYSIKKVLPILFLATIAANFSFLFCRILVDFSNVTFDLFIHGGDVGIEIDNPDGEFPETIGAICDTKEHPDVQIGIAQAFCVGKELQDDLVTTGGTLDWAVVGKLLFYTILQFIGTIFIYILAFLFYIRNYVIYFLVALSPLAFMSMVLPATKQGWSMWWTNFLRWVFLPTLSLFWLWLGSRWMSFGINSGGFSLMSAAFAGVCYYLAITTPFKVGGGIMSAYVGTSKKLAGGIYNQQGGLAARTTLWGQRMESKNEEGTFKHAMGKRLGQFGGATNIKKNVEGLAKRRAFGITNLEKAENKTTSYQKFGGTSVEIEGMKAKHEDTIMHMTPEKSVGLWETDENGLYAAAENPTSKQGRLYQKEINDILGDADYETYSEADKRAAIRQFTAAENPQNILDRYKGLGDAYKSASDVVLAQGASQKMIQYLRGNKSSEQIEAVYSGPLPSSAVPAQEATAAASATGPGSSGSSGGNFSPAATKAGQRVAAEVVDGAVAVSLGNGGKPIVINAATVQVAAQNAESNMGAAGHPVIFDPGRFSDLAKTLGAEAEGMRGEIIGRASDESAREFGTFLPVLDRSISAYGEEFASIKGQVAKNPGSADTIGLSGSSPEQLAITAAAKSNQQFASGVDGHLEALIKTSKNPDIGLEDTAAYQQAQEIRPDFDVKSRQGASPEDSRRQMVYEIETILGDAKSAATELSSPEALSAMMTAKQSQGADFVKTEGERRAQAKTHEVHREIIVERTASQMPENVGAQAVFNYGQPGNEANQALSGQFEALIASNTELSDAIKSSDPKKQVELMRDAHTSLKEAAKRTIQSSSQSGSGGASADDQAKALKQVFQDPKTAKAFAKEYGRAMEGQLKKLQTSTPKASSQSGSSTSNQTDAQPPSPPPTDAPGKGTQ